MIKDQNKDFTSEEGTKEEKKVVRRGRPKKSEQKSDTLDTATTPAATSEAEQKTKTRKPRTSTTITNEIKSLENSKAKKKSLITPIQENQTPEQEPSQTNPSETRKPRKSPVRKSLASTNTSQPTSTQDNASQEHVLQDNKEEVKPKKRGRKPKEIINLAKDLDLPEEVRNIEHSLLNSGAKMPSKTTTNPLGKSNITASSHDSIQLLPSQMVGKLDGNTFETKQAFHKQDRQLVEQDDQFSRDSNKPNRGLSKNFFKRVPLEENAIKQKETMHNPMLYPAPKQLQGKQQTKKQNNPAQNFNSEQDIFYPHTLPSYNNPENHQENQYINWQNNRSKPINKNGNTSRQKNNQNRQRQGAIKNIPQPTFDNSSIIAAISGKTFETDDIYKPVHNNGYIQNGFAPHADTIAPFANNTYPKNSRQAKGPKKNTHSNNNYRMPEQGLVSDESSILHQNMLYQRNQAPIQNPENIKKNIKNIHNIDPLALTKLPSFAQSALEHRDDFDSISKQTFENPFYPLEQQDDIQEIASEKKTRGRKKKTVTPVEEVVNEDLKMFVSVQSEEQVEVALVKDDTVVEYFVEMSHQAKIRGNIYKASIHNVDPNLQAAFINFGSTKNGFLQIDEVHPDYYLTPHAPSKNHKFPLISKVLRPGQELFVQIVKEPTLTKGAFLTTWISLAGRYLVLTPGQEQLGVSRKVSDPEERARLRSMLDGINPDKGMGIIIRTAAANASQEELQADLDYLQKLWLDILEKSNEKSAPALIHQEVELTQRVVRDYLNEDVGEIWTNDKEMAQSITKMATILYPQKANIVKLFNNNRSSLWDRFNLQKQVDDISQREIALPSGGRVVFDQTEALMAIDINSGKTQNKSNFHEMVLQTNIEAAQAIARHLRLRDIGGQVVIDFIEVHDKNAVKEIEKAFKNAMRHDRARYEIGHISPFGLLEVIRQRIGSSAISISTEPCPHCNGTGTRRNMEWQAQDALKEIAKKARQEKTIKYVYTTNTELALYLLNLKRDRISELEERFNIRIEIQAH